MERDEARELWKAVRAIGRRVSTLERTESNRAAVETDRRHLLDSWGAKAFAIAMLALQAAAIILAARGGH